MCDVSDAQLIDNVIFVLTPYFKSVPDLGRAVRRFYYFYRRIELSDSVRAYRERDLSGFWSIVDDNQHFIHFSQCCFDDQLVSLVKRSIFPQSQTASHDVSLPHIMRRGLIVEREKANLFGYGATRSRLNCVS